MGIGIKTAPRPPSGTTSSGLQLPPPPPVDEYGSAYNASSPQSARRTPSIQSNISHNPRPSGSNLVPKFAAPSKNQPGQAPQTGSPQVISSPLMMKKQQSPPGAAAPYTHARNDSFSSSSSSQPQSPAMHMRTSSNLSSTPSPTMAPQSPVQGQSLSQVVTQKPAPVRMEKPKFEESPDKDSVTRALCDYLISQLEDGIRLQKKPEYVDMKCFVSKDHTTLGIGHLSFDGTNAEGICDTANAEKHELSTIQDIREIPANKPTLGIVFNNGVKEIEFQCKDPNAYANFIDGMNALLGRAPVTKDRNADIYSIGKLLEIAQMYGPPQIPPLPPSSN